jgi:hypothetical protein
MDVYLQLPQEFTGCLANLVSNGLNVYPLMESK